MNFRLTAILFGAVLVGVVALLLVVLNDDKDVGGDFLLEELVAVKDKPEQIDVVEFERADGAKLKLVKVGKDRWEAQWDVATPGGPQVVKAKADPAAVEAVVSALLKAKPTAHPDLTNNMATHGLQPPGLKVTLKQGNEREGTIKFGDVTGGGKGVAFVTTSARPQRPLAVARSAIEPVLQDSAAGKAGKVGDLSKWAADFRSKAIFPADTRGAGDDVDAVTLTLPNKGNKTLALERTSNGWKFKTPAGWGDADVAGAAAPPPGTFTGVRPLLGVLTSMQALSPADFVEHPTAENLAAYGLDGKFPDAVRVELATKGGTTGVLIGKKDAAAPTKVWVKVDGQPGVIRANAGDLSGLVPLVENPDPLRDRTLLALDKGRIDGIDVTSGGQTVKLRKVGPEWKLYGNPAAGDPQPAAGADALLNLLTERRTITAFPPLADTNFPTRLAEVRVWSDGFEPPATDPKADPKTEPKERPNGKPVLLIFGKREGDQIYVRRTLPDGTSTDFKVPEKLRVGAADVDLLAILTKTRLDYLDRTLKGFAATNANRLTVTGAVNFDVEKQDRPAGSASPGDDRWAYAAPPEQKGKTVDTRAVEGMLDILATTPTVMRIVNETPTPEKLAEYGLGPAPRLKVVVGLKEGVGADKERVYEFGKEVGDQVYARQAGRNAVFTLPLFVYEKFAKADLRDKAIFRFDPDAVTNLKLTGWGSGGFPGTVAFAKTRDGVWEKKEGPATLTPDPAKINDFLRLLSRTRVDRFVPGGVTAEQGFGDPAQYLIIEVTTPAGLTSVNLGAPTDGGAAYYGWTNVLPANAPVFTTLAAPFKPYKEGVKAFGR